MNEQIQFLKDLQEELKTQPNDGNAAPNFWGLMDYKWMPTAEGFHDRTSIYLPKDGESWETSELYDDFINREFEVSDEDLADLHSTDATDDEMFLGWIQTFYDDGAYIVYEKKESFIVPDAMFITKAEAQKHIEMNHYHYTKDVSIYTDEAHTYAMTAWRAPKVEKLLNILMSFDWDSVQVKEGVAND
ncbi:hypothetical protein ACIQZG_02435 [Lysinibacillus sp. NPDC096418]|uniref:hypothetical protein n=1 Tax=Lysinibacillus sp. NPDC096418 TaxID=3364138 RepID=UPI0037FE3269